MENESYWELFKDSIMCHTPLVSEHFEVHEDCFGRFNGLNTSSLYSFLIKEAGRLCDHYASDMFIDLKTLDNAIAGSESVLFEVDDYRWVVGIRDYGVDHDAFLECRMKEHSVARNYRKIYYLEINLDTEATYGRYFNLALYDVSASSLDYATRKEMAV